MDIVPQKRCSKCGELKPATLEYFHRRDNKTGLHTECKRCISARSKQWRLDNPDRCRIVSKASHQKRKERDPERYKEQSRKRDRKFIETHRERKNKQSREGMRP